jgi:hypothetical protein
MSALLPQDEATQAAPRQRLLTLPVQVWDWLKSKLELIGALGRVPRDMLQMPDVSREEVLQALADMMYDDLVDDGADPDEYFSTAFEEHMEVCSEEEYYMVLALVHVYLAADVNTIIRASKHNERAGIDIDRAERCVDLYCRLGLYSTTLVLERAHGRKADPAVIHSTSGPH